MKHGTDDDFPNGAPEEPSGALKLLIPGGRGMLGGAFAARAKAEGWAVVVPPRGDGGGAMDLRRPGSVARAVAFHRPDWIVNLAAWTDVDGAERDPDGAFAINRYGAAALAKAAVREGIPILHLSTDYVFDGTATVPIPVDARMAPINTYGRSKAEGEDEVRTEIERSGGGGRAGALVVRTSTLYGPGGRNFVDTISAKVGAGEPLSVVDGLRSQPTRTFSLAEGLVRLIRAGARGTFHLTDGGDATRLELAEAIQRELGVARPIRGIPMKLLPFGGAARPEYSVLDGSATERLLGWGPSPWREELRRHFERPAEVQDVEGSRRSRNALLAPRPVQ